MIRFVYIATLATAFSQATNGTPEEVPKFSRQTVPPQQVRIPSAESRTVQSPEQESGEGPAWWQTQMEDTLLERVVPRKVDLGDLILGALRHSPNVKAISEGPLIRETAIVEEEAKFDWRAFMESRFTETNDPVGSTLTTGDGVTLHYPSRLKDKNWRSSAGLRRRLYSGGRFEIAQKMGLESSDSQNFVPEDQATSRLALNFTQPLLNGAGCAYNTSLIVLARIDTEIAEDEFSAQLQDHLLAVTRAYWELYQQRALLLQTRKWHQQAIVILEELESRRGVDSLESQIVRARAAVATRQADIIRSETSIRNIAARIRALVDDPDLLPNHNNELIPLEQPLTDQIEVGLEDSLATAMQHRPEIDAAVKNVRKATVRLGISKNELRPVLDFVAEAYVSGLEGNFALGTAYGNQWREGGPSYSVGLVFEVPLGNREARARHERRRLELQQVTYELQNAIATLKAEVEVAVREVETTFDEMQGKYRAMVALEEEVKYLQERWLHLPGEDQAPSFLLDDLLESQDRLRQQEFEYVTAQVAYTLSLSDLKRAMGTLLEAEAVEQTRVCEDCLPAIHLDKRTTKSSP